jgi:hypothetical protein
VGRFMKERRVGRAIAMKETKAKAEAEKIKKMKKEFQQAIRSLEESAEKAEEIYGKRDAPAMMRMYQRDVKDLRRVFKLWSQHKYNEADEVAWKMDTAGRENIPDSVWRDIQRKIGTN